MKKKTSAYLETVPRERHRLVEEDQEGTMVTGILGTRPLKVEVLVGREEQGGLQENISQGLETGMCLDCSGGVRG